MSTDPFTPSLVRRGLNELLLRYPHLDLVQVMWPDSEEMLEPWVLVVLGQHSEGMKPAWARWQFAIWKQTGSVYRMESGAVEDDPIIEVPHG